MGPEIEHYIQSSLSTVLTAIAFVRTRKRNIMVDFVRQRTMVKVKYIPRSDGLVLGAAPAGADAACKPMSY